MSTQQDNLPTVVQLQKTLGTMQNSFRSTLPPHIKSEKFLRAAVTAVQNTPDLQECEVASIVSSCQKAAIDGLILDGREAALITFNKKDKNGKWGKQAQYMPMVAGILKKARNSGQISAISAHVVYDNDEFSYELGMDPRIVHRPLIDGEPGNLRCAYAIAKLRDGSVQFEVMTKSQIHKIMQSSKSGWDDKKNQAKGIWLKWEDEMWRKTALKRLAKYLPSSSDLDAVIDYDNREFGLEIEPAPEAEAPKAAPKKKATRAKAAIVKQKVDKADPEIEDGEIIPDVPEHPPIEDYITDDDMI